MHKLNEPVVVREITERINNLRADSARKRGKMNVAQMLAHCSVAMENSLGDRIIKQGLMGKIFGALAKKSMMGPKPAKAGMPTDPNFVVQGDEDFATEQQRLANLVSRFATTDADTLARNQHPFFGKMTADDWGILNYKHLDHHLRQFGV